MRRLKYCGSCKEYSMVTKIYNGNKRVQYCINKGCGRKYVFPPLKEERYEADNVIIGIR
jgi:hypothetical protein